MTYASLTLKGNLLYQIQEGQIHNHSPAAPELLLTKMSTYVKCYSSHCHRGKMGFLYKYLQAYIEQTHHININF